MLKVSDIAKKLNISRQSVYYWLDKLDKELEPHIYKRDGATVIGLEGVKMIQARVLGNDSITYTLTEEKHEHSPDPDTTELLEHYKGLIDTLKGQLEEKDRQLEEKEKQLAKKDEMLERNLERNNDLLQNFQVIVRQSQEKVRELEGEFKEQKQGWWQRLKLWK